MKNLILIALLFITTLSYSQKSNFNINTWNTVYYVDEFEDPIYSSPHLLYITDVNTEKYAHIIFIIDNYSIKIKVYNRFTKKVEAPKYSTLIKFKDINKEIYYIKEKRPKVNYKENYIMYSNPDDYANIIVNMLLAEKELKFIISLEEDKELVITINTTKFAEAYQHIYPNSYNNYK